MRTIVREMKQLGLGKEERLAGLPVFHPIFSSGYIAMAGWRAHLKEQGFTELRVANVAGLPRQRAYWITGVYL
jgi:hypothetical protein